MKVELWMCESLCIYDSQVAVHTQGG